MGLMAEPREERGHARNPTHSTVLCTQRLPTSRWHDLHLWTDTHVWLSDTHVRLWFPNTHVWLPDTFAGW